MSYPFGIDISKYQYSADGKQKPNFDLMNSTCDFVAVRSGISWGYVDPWFNYSWSHIIRPRLAYHVVYPGENAVRQMEHFLNIVQPTDNDRLVLDLELDHGYPKGRITQTIIDCLEYLKGAVGMYPVVYSRAEWINRFVEVSALPEDLLWWLAHYLKRLPGPKFTPERIAPPARPTGVDRWTFHQTAEHQDGSKVGVVSHYVDTNRFNGTKEDLAAFFGFTELPEPEPEPLPEPLYEARVYEWATPYVNIRREPIITSPKRGVKYPLELTDVLGLVNEWSRVPEGYMVSKYLEPLVDLPPSSLLSIAPLSQRDPRWAEHKLGFSYYTIAQQGCLLTDLTMVANYYNKNTTPDALNDALVGVGGFTGANLYWQAITQIYPDIFLSDYIDCFYVPAPLDKIDALLSEGVPVLVHVDFVPGGAVDQHWVTLLDRTVDDYVMADPWYGTKGSFRERYGDPARWIFRIRAYRKR